MTQSEALDILKTGANVFVTGEPGTGKTYVINEHIAWLEAAGVHVAVTASTGIAATHIGGMTIHAWSGIGIRDALTPHDLDTLAAKEKTVKRIMRAQVLVIDEISMLDGAVLDMVDRVCRFIRKKNEAFGGIVVVFVGDFFQLPPVTRQGGTMRYAFESRAWEDARPLACYLTEQYRQDDEMLVGLLKSIRRNDIDESHYTLLSEQTDIAYRDIEPTRLYTHNADVDAVNKEQLASLSGAAATFQMKGQGNKQLIAGLAKNCLSPETLSLKEEAMVMCTKNNFEAGYVNGTLGRVIGFDRNGGYPIIKTADGREITVEPASWSVTEDGKVLAEVSQVPLRLAWAITVHKSQGMSLDAAIIDLSRAFVYGQGYVALSRVRTLAGLKMLGMCAAALQVDPKVVAKDSVFQNESAATEQVFGAMDADEIAGMHERFVRACGGRMPKGDLSREPRILKKRARTTEETKELLLQKKTIAQIAKERSIAESTVWSHIEDLIAERAITVGDLDYLFSDTWSATWDDIQAAIEEVGDEKLKPIFEHLNETYDYPTIRLARAYYRLLQNEREGARV